jgi:hypothetical protein
MLGIVVGGMRARRRRTLAVAAGVVIAASILAGTTAAASASVHQLSIIQDDTRLLTNPRGTLSAFRALGDSMVRVIVDWAAIAPAAKSRTPPSALDATNPDDYPAANWAPYDAIVKLAAADGIAVDFTLSGGAPRWAEGPGIPRAAVGNPFWAWRPSARAFGQFARAVGKRYSGTYVPPGETDPLPRVSFWALWNEPNFGEDLGPQAVAGSTVSVAPGMYRNLIGQAWNALHETGHARDTILIGETAPRGLSAPSSRTFPQGLPGQFGQTRPLEFIRTLYCVDSRLRQLRGSAATSVGCPATAAASRSFRRQNPALFQANGFADHPYPDNQAPPIEQSTNMDVAPFARISNLERELDGIQRLYGSSRRFAIYSTEYGYITHPPNRRADVSPPTAAYYLNWAEYLSWKQPRVASTMQYLLYDPPVLPTGDGGFTSGLLYIGGRAKPAYGAYRLPLYLPVTSTRGGHNLEVWGCVRPARFPLLDSGEPQMAQIQFAPGSSGTYGPLQTVIVRDPGNCYFDVRMTFPASGTVRLAYTYPLSALGLAGTTVYSRPVAVTVR